MQTKREERAIVRLYKAAQEYVRSKGGEVCAAGGIQIQQWPDARPGNFLVAIKCTGKKPEYAQE